MAVIDQYRTRKPNESNRERLVSEALMANAAPAEELRSYRAVPRVELFPPRYGYPTEALTIEEVVDIPHLPNGTMPFRRDFTGSNGAYASSFRPSGTGWW